MSRNGTDGCQLCQVFLLFTFTLKFITHVMVATVKVIIFIQPVTTKHIYSMTKSLKIRVFLKRHTLFVLKAGRVDAGGYSRLWIFRSVFPVRVVGSTGEGYMKNFILTVTVFMSILKAFVANRIYSEVGRNKSHHNCHKSCQNRENTPLIHHYLNFISI